MHKQKEPTFSLDVAISIFNVLFGQIPNPAMNLLSRDYTVLWANKGMAIGVQRPLEELIGRPCYQAFRRREKPCEVCLLEIVSETKKPFVGERLLDLPGKERQYAEIRAYPLLDARGVQFLLEIVAPMTGRKKDEARRQRYIQSLERSLGEMTKVAPTTLCRDGSSGQGAALTPRETEVLRLLAKGFTNKEIASILTMSPDTAKTHITHIIHKLDVTDRTEAAVWASLNRLI